MIVNDNAPCLKDRVVWTPIASKLCSYRKSGTRHLHAWWPQITASGKSCSSSVFSHWINHDTSAESSADGVNTR